MLRKALLQLQHPGDFFLCEQVYLKVQLLPFLGPPAHSILFH
jgi:hypothetical protein